MKKQHVDNVILVPGYLNIRAGGPLGYVANLQEGFRKNDIKNVRIVSMDKNESSRFYFIKRLISLIPLKNLRYKIKQQYIQTHSFKNYDFLLEYGRFFPKNMKEYLFKKLDKYSFDTITVHALQHFMLAKEYIDTRKLKSKILVQSHSPEAPSDELYRTLLNQGFSKDYAKEYKKHAFELDRKAFENADIVLFPSKEAMDPYGEFADILKHKEIKFIPTGIKPLVEPKESVENLRKKFGIKTKYVISYIGRHTAIKGYNSLKKAAEILLKKHKDITFLIGGSGEIKPLKHSRWIEIGRCQPNEVLKISDAFILPNKQTYFDLILLETISMGVPVFASNTGGNKSVAKQTKCIFLYDDNKQLIEQINKFLKLSDKKRSDIKNNILKSFNKYYTQDIFANNYSNLIKDIVKK